MLLVFLKWTAKQFGADENVYGRVFVSEDEMKAAQDEEDERRKRETEESRKWGVDVEEVEKRLAVLEMHIETMRKEREQADRGGDREDVRRRNGTAAAVQRARDVARALRRTSVS